MSQIEWNSVGGRRYEVGIDRGVLYLPAQETAVPWNGLISVDEASDATIEPFYFNGVKYFDYVSKGDFQATLKAFTYPPEFEEFDGVLESPTNGIFITGQRQSGVFHLSYRTMIGNDVDGLNGGYKIHVLYNLTAKPSNKSYSTLDNASAAYEFSWELSSVPVDAFNLRPSSHIIFDTTKMHPAAIIEVERVLYGNEEQEPEVISVDEFEEITNVADDLIITDHGDGTWSAEGSEYYIKQRLRSTEFAIENSNAVYLDEHTFQVSSST